MLQLDPTDPNSTQGLRCIGSHRVASTNLALLDNVLIQTS